MSSNLASDLFFLKHKKTQINGPGFFYKIILPKTDSGHCLIENYQLWKIQRNFGKFNNFYSKRVLN